MRQEGFAVSAVIVGVLAWVGLTLASHPKLSLLGLVLIGWGLFSLIQGVRKAHRTIRPNSSFVVEEQSDGQLRFNVQVANRRNYHAIAAIFVGLILASIVGLITGVMAGFGGTPFLLLASPITGIITALLILHRNADHRVMALDTRIYVSNHTVNYPDPEKDFALQRVDASIIDRLRIEQSVGELEIFHAIGGSPMQAFNQMSAKGRAKWLNWYAAHSYVLEIHAQGKRHVLAGGMDEVTSHGLMQAISRKLGI